MKLRILLIISFLAQNTFAQTVRNDFEKYFKECKLTGSFVLYDLKKNHYTYYNEKDFTVKTCPASTFKIPNSLIALETGVIKDENEVLKWDGKKRWVDAWNADTDMKAAFKNSTVWYYQELARRIGAKNYRKYLKSCDYGNQDISGKIVERHPDEFWLNNTLKISPKNQIEFLVKLYQNKLPFSKRTIDIFKNVMIAEQTDKYVLRAKTGWYRQDEDKEKQIGWWVGYIEKGSDAYFFAIRVYDKPEVSNPNFMNCRKEITKKILTDLGVF
jgi:beta-lactamase class D